MYWLLNIYKIKNIVLLMCLWDLL